MYSQKDVYCVACGMYVQIQMQMYIPPSSFKKKWKVVYLLMTRGKNSFN